MCGAHSSKYGNRFSLLRVEKGKLTKIPDFFLEKSQEINSNKRIHSFTYAKLRMTNHLAITRFRGERVNILRLLNSRGEARGAGRLHILDQSEAQRAKKKNLNQLKHKQSNPKSIIVFCHTTFAQKNHFKALNAFP